MTSRTGTESGLSAPSDGSRPDRARTRQRCERHRAQLPHELGTVAPTGTEKSAADLEVPPVGCDVPADQLDPLVLILGVTHGSSLVWTKPSDQNLAGRAP